VSKSTTLSEAQLNHSPHDVITIEQIEHLETPPAVREAALVLIRWPLHPTLCDPQRFPDVAATAARLFAQASTTLAGIKARRQLCPAEPSGACWLKSELIFKFVRQARCSSGKSTQSIQARK
jgi:hypothetical protein